MNVDFKESYLYSKPGVRVELLGEYKYIRVYLDLGVTLLWNKGKTFIVRSLSQEFKRSRV